MPKKPPAKKSKQGKGTWNRATVTVAFQPADGSAQAKGAATMVFQPSYDDASWHYGGDFPSSLPDRAGGTHIGMFAAWMWLNGLESETARRECQKELKLLRGRKGTPGVFVMNVLDGKIIAADFSEEGNAFLKAYYQEEKKSELGQFLDDYADVHKDSALPTLYHVEDSWENYDRLAKVIDRRYRDWKRRTEYRPPRRR